jgi:hypothetical protein
LEGEEILPSKQYEGAEEILDNLMNPFSNSKALAGY